MSETYSISEAAALTGRHPNTIRLKVRMGQLRAEVTHGKFGEEYRIGRPALEAAGLLAPAQSPGKAHPAHGESTAQEERDGAGSAGPAAWAAAPSDSAGPFGRDGLGEETDLLQPELVEGRSHEHAAPEQQTGLAVLADMARRHEQAMFRLGYLQGELDRLRMLEETAESLRRQREKDRQLIQDLQRADEERQRLEEEVTRLRDRLEHARQSELRLEALYSELAELRRLAEEQEQALRLIEAERSRPWWRFWS